MIVCTPLTMIPPVPHLRTECGRCTQDTTPRTSREPQRVHKKSWRSVKAPVAWYAARTVTPVLITGLGLASHNPHPPVCATPRGVCPRHLVGITISRSPHMTRTRLALVAIAGAALAAGAAPSRPGPDTKALANTLVTTCAGVHENDIVYIEGGIKEQELLENISANVSKAGGHPLLTFGSDRLSRMTYEMTPEKYDSRTPTLGLKLASLANVMITVDYGENPSLFADVPPARAAAMGKARAAVEQAMLKNNVRTVS